MLMHPAYGRKIYMVSLCILIHCYIYWLVRYFNDMRIYLFRNKYIPIHEKNYAHGSRVALVYGIVNYAQILRITSLA